MALIGMLIMMMAMGMIILANGIDSNGVFDPCSDAQIRKGDGFSFGLAFASKEAFFSNQVQLSPCDSRLGLASKDAQLAVFRPQVDQISLLTINSSQFDMVKSGGFMVAFAGRKYAARSFPVKVADSSNTIKSFTLVLEFQRGTLQNLYWKSFGCDSCTGDATICVDKTDCAVPTSKCKSNGGSIDCDIGIQLTFSGTDKNLQVLNSWYEVSKLKQDSLYDLYSNVLDTISGGVL